MPRKTAGIVAKTITLKLALIFDFEKCLCANRYINKANNEAKWADVSYK